jgi:Amt family ammonium transporter
MFPGLGYFYGGITHRKNLLTTLLSTSLGLGVVSIQVILKLFNTVSNTFNFNCSNSITQWFIWGYSLSFSEKGSIFIGNLNNAFFMDVGDRPHPNAPTIPSNLFMLYQG